MSLLVTFKRKRGIAMRHDVLVALDLLAERTQWVLRLSHLARLDAVGSCCWSAFLTNLYNAEMGTRVLGLGLESDSSPDLAGLGLGLESFTSGLGLGLGLETCGLGLDSDSDRRDSTGLGKLQR